MGPFYLSLQWKKQQAQKEPDFVEKAPNTYPNLCGPVNQHARQEESKHKKGERAKGEWVCKVNVCWRLGSGGEAYNAT